MSIPVTKTPGILKTTGTTNRVSQFLDEVKVELRKATWPWDPKEKGVRKYKEIIDSTVVVVVAMLLLGGYVALWDLVLNAFIGRLIR